MPIVDVTDTDFEERVLKSGMPVLVDFWAPWCGPCKMAEPVLDELSEEYKDKIQVVKLNVDENQQTASKYEIMSIPTTVLIKGGKELARQVGFAGKQAFEELMTQSV